MPSCWQSRSKSCSFLVLLPQRFLNCLSVRLYWGELAPVVSQEFADPEREERQAFLQEVRGGSLVLVLVDRQKAQPSGTVNSDETVTLLLLKFGQIEAAHVDKARAVVLKLPVMIGLPCCLLLLFGQATLTVVLEQAVDTGTSGPGQHLLYRVRQIIEGQTLLAQAQDKGLFVVVKSISDLVRAAASVTGAGAVLPAVNGRRRDHHLLCQSAASFGAASFGAASFGAASFGAASFWAACFCAVDEALPLLFVGGCVRMQLHTCSSFLCVVTKKTTVCTSLNASLFRTDPVHNDMKLDT
jgi:hypothetical protein